MDMQFYRKMFFSTALFLGSAMGLFAQEAAIWELGKADQSSQEFALSPLGYKDFLAHDFGYEDNFFVVGQSVLNQDFPYVLDRKSTRLNSSHVKISYAVFCL